MPDKPLWYGKLEEAIREIEASPDAFVDRAQLQQALGVGKRRAQQLLQPLISRMIGRSAIAGKTEVIAHLRRVAAQETAYYERRRRERFVAVLDKLRSQPRLLVEAPAGIERQEIEGLSGVTLAPGKIIVEFAGTEEALQKLLALAMAISNDYEGFDARIS